VSGTTALVLGHLMFKYYTQTGHSHSCSRFGMCHVKILSQRLVTPHSCSRFWTSHVQILSHRLAIHTHTHSLAHTIARLHARADARPPARAHTHTHQNLCRSVTSQKTVLPSYTTVHHTTPLPVIAVCGVTLYLSHYRQYKH
jgi:hypothetical protein